MESPTEKRLRRQGAPFQLLMMAVYLITIGVYHPATEARWTSWWSIPSHLGGFLFLYCLIRIYFRRREQPELLTTGPFRYTRHPMYTGLFLMNLILWLPVPVTHDVWFFVGQVIFLLCMLGAGWFQEKETLARFGQAAAEYYARTPRLFLCYPFVAR